MNRIFLAAMTVSPLFAVELAGIPVFETVLGDGDLDVLAADAERFELQHDILVEFQCSMS